MRSRFLSLIAMAGSVLCLGTAAFGQDATIDFTGVANYNVQALGAYAGYYTGTVNGVTENPGFICDDYNNEIFLPSESWQATATTFSSLVTSTGQATSALGTTLFGNTIGLAGYAAIANLASLMATTSASGQGDISAAIWYIGSLGSSDVVPWANLDAGAQNLVNEMIGLYGNLAPGTADSNAIAELEDSSLWIYTPTGKDITPVGDPYPQEFVGNVAVPEGGAPLAYLLLAGVTCFGAMRFRSRGTAVKQIAA